jgi:hypothetical protein
VRGVLAGFGPAIRLGILAEQIQATLYEINSSAIGGLQPDLGTGLNRDCWTRADAQQPEPIWYVLRMPAPKTHYIEVQAMYPRSRRWAIELMMPVWTPGSYLVREFARYVEEVRARDPAGHALQVVKSRKNRWRVEAERAGAVVLTYRVYAHERQARTNWVEDSLRPDQRCSDLHHPGRARAASSRARSSRPPHSPGR